MKYLLISLILLTGCASYKEVTRSIASTQEQLKFGASIVCKDRVPLEEVKYISVWVEEFQFIHVTPDPQKEIEFKYIDQQVIAYLKKTNESFVMGTFRPNDRVPSPYCYPQVDVHFDKNPEMKVSAKVLKRECTRMMDVEIGSIPKVKWRRSDILNVKITLPNNEIEVMGSRTSEYISSKERCLAGQEY